MRIIQMIDSLEVGGAEKMAINYANALSDRIEFSGLVVTRKEGSLKSLIQNNVNYYFLNKKHTLDLRSVLKLKKFCKQNKIEMIQAHGSSYFTAFLLKIIYPQIKIIWHDHNGFREFLGSQEWVPLKIVSFFFKGVIVVNSQLKKWVQKELYCKEVIYLPNFTNLGNTNFAETLLQGTNGKKILYLANLRDPKNHILLLNVAEKLKNSHPDWSFHLIGKISFDEYSKEINKLIKTKKLEQTVFLYGLKSDTENIINQSEIALITSKSEGLPVTLLEYGLCKKPVVVTDVGEIPLIIQNGKNGLIVSSDNVVLFYDALINLIENPDLRINYGEALYKTIMDKNSEKFVMNEYLNWITKL